MRSTMILVATCAVADLAHAQVIPFDRSHVRVLAVAPPSTSHSTGVSPLGASLGKTPVDDATVLELGMGYDALTGDIIPNVCVDANGHDLTFGQSEVGATYNHEYINTVTDMADSDSASGSSAGFDFTYKLITVGFQTGSDSSSMFNSVDNYGRIYKKLVTRGVARDNGKWSAIGAAAIQKPIATFTSRCGTHYIRGIYYGHTLDETVRFKLSTSKLTSADKNGFSLGVAKLFSFNYSDTSAQTDVDSRGSLSIVDESRGLANAIKISDGAGVQTLVKYAREDYPVKVQATKPQDAAILDIEVVPYYRLAAIGASTMPRWPDEIRAMIVAKGPLYKQLLSAISDIEYAVGLPTDDVALGQLYRDSRIELTNKQTAAINIQKSIRAAAVACRALLDKAVSDQAGMAKCGAQLDAALTPAIVASVRPLTK